MKPKSRSIQKVLLLFPPARLRQDTVKTAAFPLGIGYLAAFVRDDVDVDVVDAAVSSNHEHYMGDDYCWLGAPMSEIRAHIERSRPDIVGITCLFSSIFPVVRKICQEIKAVDPDIVTIIGGAYPHFMPEHCLGAEPALDMISLGEGETGLRDVISHLRRGAALDDVDGLAFRDGDRVVVNPKTKWIEDLDTIPFPARDLFPMDLYRKHGVPHGLSSASRDFAPLLTSRGCPARCIYCSSTKYWGNRYRLRSADNVLQEIDELVGRFGIKEIQFEDDNMTANRKRAKAIFNGIIERGHKIHFNFPNGTALWTLDEEMVDLMVEAGCYEITLAFESGSPEVLRDIIKKPTNLDKAAAITRYIRKKKIRTDAFYIIGFPGETREQIQQTFDFADRMKTDVANFFVANPLPGTEFLEIAVKNNMLRDDFDFENLAYTRSAYNDTVSPGPEELEALAARAFVRYNLRSALRKPQAWVKKMLFDLMLRRPRYTLALMVRVWRRITRRRQAA